MLPLDLQGARVLRLRRAGELPGHPPHEVRLRLVRLGVAAAAAGQRPRRVLGRGRQEAVLVRRVPDHDLEVRGNAPRLYTYIYIYIYIYIHTHRYTCVYNKDNNITIT